MKNKSNPKVVLESGRVTVIAPKELGPRDAERLAMDLLRAAAAIRANQAIARVTRATP